MRNLVAPVPAKLSQPLPYLPDAQDVPAGNLFGQQDEDPWIPPQPRAIRSLPFAFSADEIIVPPPTLLGVDEDYWLQLPAVKTPWLAWITGDDEALPVPVVLDKRGTATLASEAVVAILSDLPGGAVGYGSGGYGGAGYGAGSTDTGTAEIATDAPKADLSE